MQNHTETSVIGAHILPSVSRTTYDIKIEFHANGPALPSSDRQLKHLIDAKIKNKEFFYGIEISARSYYPNTILDYRAIGPILPLFTSIVWLSTEYWSVENIEEVESMKLARKLQTHSVVLPHFACYHLNETRLKDFLNLNYTNILAIRGDLYDHDQEYKHSMELVGEIRKLKGDSVTIGVAGYPEGHPECLSIDEDLEYLVKKVKAGADFIITQICFTPQSVIEFIMNCRSKEIQIPILVGIFVPDNLRMLETVLRITKIKMSPEALEEYKQHNALGRNQFTDYAVHKAVEMIDTILSSNVDVYGVQFFTLNKFQSIPKVLNEIYKNEKLINKK